MKSTVLLIPAPGLDAVGEVVKGRKLHLRPLEESCRVRACCLLEGLALLLTSVSLDEQRRIQSHSQSCMESLVQEELGALDMEVFLRGQGPWLEGTGPPGACLSPRSPRSCTPWAATRSPWGHHRRKNS